MCEISYVKNSSNWHWHTLHKWPKEITSNTYFETTFPETGSSLNFTLIDKYDM